MLRLPVLATRDDLSGRPPPRPVGLDPFAWGALVDPDGRRYEYLRLSVTDRCDLACVYCMPPGGEQHHALRRELLDFDEAARLVSVFASLGIRRVRLTGGEPLVRRDVVRLVELLTRRSGLRDVVMTTNGTRLAELALPLRRAGLTGVNVSLDSLDPDRFRRITRGGELARVLAGLHAAVDAGFEVRINVVALGGQNEDEWGRLVDFAWDLGATPRFIELMPLGEASRLPATWFVPAARVVEVLGSRLLREVPGRYDPGRGPARYLEAADGSGRRVGFITAVTDTFCDRCNRVRVTARGELRPCLASARAVDLRNVMRTGGSDADVAWAVRWALGAKDRGHGFLDPARHEHVEVGMSLVGG
ncbi:MAG: GTP 3',8-cyclase MoaA [Myxococcota bacterium]|nr:GTP 3',8-cyclase MoaA [Myxococcota bacterium]MDW8362330.1 GTP 3',8-cyclase MoaA [Myxococcales bacterium]